MNYQVQDFNGERWSWFSDFRSRKEAKDMMEVYQKYYPKRRFRIVEQPARH